MNFLGHTQVALGIDDDPEFLLGAVLPDLAPMARVRLDRSQLSPALARGVRSHLEADAAFHALPSFREGTATIRAELVEAGLRRGPARAVAHAGFELLLDGQLLGSSAEVAFHAALAQAGEGAVRAMAAEGHRQRWLGFLERWRGLPPPKLRYDSPAWVAERLHAMLSARPRLAFPATEVPTVHRVLAAHGGWVATRTEGTEQQLN